IENARWDPKKNSIHINFIQGKDLREAIADTSIEILGEKGDTIYIIAGQDVATRATNGTATAGRNYVLHGRMLKLAGDHPSVGVTLANNASGKKFILTRDMIAINNPTQLMLLLPANMDNGDYTVTVTTQYSHSGTLLKAPRSTATVITVGNSPDDIGTLPTEPPNSGGGGYIDPNT
ncbi:MAG: DUF4469 domain-containing protein, partial [Mediterranea sp.]|nr:DUF4469 domain-containing protein [Mediterranea sp.]